MISIDIITAFKNDFIFNNNFFLYKRAIKNNIIKLNLYDLRKYSVKNKIDDKIYGSEYGMLYKFNPINKILNKINKRNKLLIYPHPSGISLNNKLIKSISDSKKNLIFICDRYEGTDCRFIQHFNPLIISLGNYVISNGELASLVILDSIIRYLMLDKKTLSNESFESDNNNLLDNFNYTKPRKTYNYKVPEILLSGHHKNINDYLWERKILNTLIFKKKIFLKNKFDNLNFNKKKIIINNIIYFLKILNKIIKKNNE
jgi:tRNA (guanine37-N1)-methyltransferase